MTTYDTNARQPLRYILSLSVLTFLSATTTSASPQHCSNAPTIGLDETLRGEGRQAGAPDCFRLRMPAGLLMFDLAVPGIAAAEPRLGLLGPRCGRSADVDLIERSASHLLVSSDAPQELTVCVGAQNPRQELGEYKLRTAFVDLAEYGAKKVDEIEVEPDPFGGCTQKVDEIEVEPDPFGGCTQKVDEIEVEPDPFAAGCLKAEEIEADPDPSPVASRLKKSKRIPTHSSDRTYWALCRADSLDDYPDNMLCATAIELGRSIRGEISNGWGDDHDIFAFELTTVQTVLIETSGEVDTFGGLYDRSGQRLATAGDDAENAQFRLVKTLQPGMYFVRVEGIAGSRGDYTLAFNAVEHSW